MFWRLSRKTVFVAFVAAGCHSAPMETAKAPGPQLPPAISTTDARIDFPDPKESVETGGITALRMPASRADVEQVVVNYFKAIAREDLGAIAEASVRGAVTKGGGSLVEAWRSRFAGAAFQLLANREIAQMDAAEIRTSDGWRFSLPPEQHADLMVVVPLNSTIVTGPPLLGARATFLLKYEGKMLKIVYASDDDPR